MFNWLLIPAERVAIALQRVVPARLRGLQRLTPQALDRAGPGLTGSGSARPRLPVQLVLPEQGLLQQRLDLPKGETTPNPGWLAARVEALSPWDRDACLWDARVEAGVVHLALIPLHPVAEAEAALARQGVRLAEVVSGPFRFRHDRVQVRRWRDRLALAAALVTSLALGLGGMGVQFGRQAQDRTALADATLARTAARLAEGAGPAQAALDLLQLKGASVALALAHLARALPQDSYLTTLSVTAHQVADGTAAGAAGAFELSGQTAQPEAIIPALSADSAFAEVDFAGPAARNPDSGSYSFTIRGTWVGR